MTDSTIQEDVPGFDDDEAVFLKRFAEEPEDTAEATKTPEEPKDTEEAAEVDETPEDTEAKEPAEADDEAIVRVKEGEKEFTFKIADLKRLAGQEAALTRKTQEVAAVTQRATDETEKALGLVGKMIEQADKVWTDMGYDKVDLNLAAQRLPEAAYRQLRSDMEAAHRQRVFLRQEGDSILSQVRQSRMAEHQKALSTVDATMAKTVPGWTKEQRVEVISYAKTQGLPDAIAEGLIDPAAIQMIRKAMLFDRGTKAAETKVKAAATSAPGKTLKSGSSSDAKPDKHREALARLRKTGSADDAESAFLARFGG